MSSGKDTSEQTYSDQLLDFESQLSHTMDDESLLQDVFSAIRVLLKENPQGETDIRKILHDRFEAGELREDTFQVVQRMLDRIVSDFVATLPGDEPEARDFADTDVIPGSALEIDVAEERLQAGSVLRDRFLLQQRIAGGSMGVVYKALDRRLAEVDDADPWVAIKVLTPKLSRNANALRAMQQEAAKGRCLTHPNIVRFIDLDRDDDLYFMVMEWIDGRSLAAVLDDPKTEQMDLDTALEIVRQVARALDYAHRCGVVHADVKPGNLMIMPDGKVKLIDFGVARIRQQQSKSPSKFDPAILGAATPAYSSMQVLTGEDPVPADDVFSLGCLMYRLIAGYRVFGPRNAAEAAEEGMVPQEPQGLSDRQWRALKKALAFSRVARYASPKAFMDDLFGRTTGAGRNDEEGEDTVVNVVTPDEPRRWPKVVGFAAVLAAGVGYVATQTDLLDEYLEQLPVLPDTAVVDTPDAEPGSAARPAAAVDADVQPESTVEVVDSEPESASADFAPAVTGTADAASETQSEFQSGLQSELQSELAETETETETIPIDEIFADDSDPVPETVGDAISDAAEIPLAATHSMMLGVDAGVLDVVLREDTAPAVIDIVRSSEIAVPLSLRLEEVGFSGNRSPWESGQYSIGDDGVVEFAAGQTVTQVTLSMMSDPLREADREVELVLREADAPDRDLGSISLVLEDDDQRAFESSLAQNTIAFAVSQVSVGENDPAVQIDVLRFNPDQQPVEVRYIVQDVTATEGEDYFAPRIKTIYFAPGQRTARLLIPLVQDSAVETDEAFFLEFDNMPADANIFSRIAVMIRDDDP